MNKHTLIALLAIFLNALFIMPAVANQKNATVNIGTAFGTNGLNISAARSINDYLGARIDIGTGVSLKQSRIFNKNNYSVEYSPKTSGIILDVTPFQGSFYLAAGLIKQDIKLSLTGKIDLTYDFNGTTYSLGDNIKSVTGSVGFDKSSAPYLGLGWTNRYKKTMGFTYAFDIGIVNVGVPQTSINVDCVNPVNNASFCSNLNADVAAEKNNINNDISTGNISYLIITLGFGYSF